VFQDGEAATMAKSLGDFREMLEHGKLWTRIRQLIFQSIDQLIIILFMGAHNEPFIPDYKGRSGARSITKPFLAGHVTSVSDHSKTTKANPWRPWDAGNSPTQSPQEAATASTSPSLLSNHRVRLY